VLTDLLDLTVRRRSAGDRTADSEDRYRGLLEAAPDAMVVVDQAGEIVLLNVQAEKQFGYHRDELIGQPVTNIIPEGFAERLIADDLRSAEDALAQQIGTGIELSARRKNGTEFPIEIMLSPLESAGVILVTAAIRDITARKDAETHLAQSEGRYRGLLEAAPDAMIVVNQAGEIVLLNVQAEKQLGYRRDELLGQPVTNIIPEGFAERLIADDLRSAEDALAQQIDTGIELTALRKDGTEFPIEIMLSPLESAEGVLVTAAIRDITARKDSEGRYRGLLEAAPDAMVVVNQAGEIVLLNVQAEKQFGYRRDELLGQRVTNIIPEGFAARLIADDLRSAADALAQQIGTGIELIARRKDGSEFPIEIMLSPLDSAEGTLVTAAIRDITVRNEAEEHLAQKVDELSRSVSAARAMSLEMVHAAQHDFLTGLPNRMLLNDRISQAIVLAPRHSQQVAVLFLDLDGFKHINDSLGHSVGDKLLQSIATRLVGCVRLSDTVSRQGGDEFVVLLSEAEQWEDVDTVARRILQAVAEVHLVDKRDLHITASIGISIYPDDGGDSETLIKNADTAMYQAKENGRQGYQYFRPAMNARAVER
jgi:diguanylate cyclase (GGDEF)-like protein/PAS domain S-box-containing protein